MDLRRLRIGEWIAGVGGAALLGVMFLGWYDVWVSKSESAPAYAGIKTIWGTVSAWESFAALDVLLAITAALGIAVAVMAAVHNTPAASLALASLLLLVGAIATIWLVVRALSPPAIVVEGVTAREEAVERAAGLWIGLGVCVITCVGAFVSMRDERFPRGARVEVPIETLPPPEGGKA